VESPNNMSTNDFNGAESPKRSASPMHSQFDSKEGSAANLHVPSPKNQGESQATL